MPLTGDDLVVVIPLWRRTDHIARVCASVRAATPAARIMLVVSADDNETRWAAERVCSDYPLKLGPWITITDEPGGSRGDYARKINAGYRATVEPFIFTGADDLHFHPGWYDAARAEMEVPLAQGGGSATEPGAIGVVGTRDLCNSRTMMGEHSTHSLVARWYADCCAVLDQPGAIYSEQYWHEYCDDELCQTAMRAGAYVHAHDAVVEHLHPNVMKAPMDETYAHGRQNTARSRAMYRQRARRLGFVERRR